MTEHDEGVLKGMLDQATADIPALRTMENMAINQCKRAERLEWELQETRRQHWHMALAALIEFFVIVVLAAVVWAKR